MEQELPINIIVDSYGMVCDTLLGACETRIC